MRGGWLGGVAAGLMMVALAGTAQGAIVVNGRPVSTQPAARVEGDLVLVPVIAFAPFLGVEASEHDGRIVLRWSGGSEELASAELREESGTAFTSLEGLVRRVGGTERRSGDDTIVDTPIATLVEVVRSGEELAMRFDRFAPTSVGEEDGETVIRFANCLTVSEGAAAAFGPSDVGRATLTTIGDGSCEVRIEFLEEAALSVRRVEANEAYTVFLTASEQASSTSSVRIADNLLFLEGEIGTGEESVQVAYIWAGEWRGRLDVRPLLPQTGVGTQASINAAMSAAGAAIALSSRSGTDVGLVVIDGVPYSLGDGASEALGIDILGSFLALVPDVAASAVSPTARIPLDGVDRPVGADELIGYPPGYTGNIAKGFPEGFRIVRIRDSVVVSILDAPFVVADPSAALLVASGAARSRLAALTLGDRVTFESVASASESFLTEAASIEGWFAWDGQSTLRDWDSASPWSTVGTDWQGGLFFLRLSSDGEISPSLVLAALNLLPVPARDVAILEAGGAAELALDSGNYHMRWGRRVAVSVSLGAVLK